MEIVRLAALELGIRQVNISRNNGEGEATMGDFVRQRRPGSRPAIRRQRRTKEVFE